MQYHPGGQEEAAAALKAGAHLAPLVHPAITASNPQAVSEGLFGKPMPATGLWDKIKSLVGDGAQWVGQAVRQTEGTIGSINATNQLNVLSQRQMRLGGPGKNPALDQQIADLSKQADPKDHLGAVPSFILGIPYQLGYQGLAAADTVANEVASLATLEPLRKTFGILPGTNFEANATWGADALLGSFTGAVYRGRLAAGADNTNATLTAIGAGVAQAALMMVKIPGLGKAIDAAAGAGATTLESMIDNAVAKGATRAAAERIIFQAAEQGTLKPALSGTLSATAKRIALPLVQQTAYGVIGAAVNDSATVISDVVHNAAHENKIPLPSALSILADLGIGGLGGLTMGGMAELAGAASRLIPGGFLDRAAQDAAKQVDAKRAEGTVPGRPTVEQNRSAYDSRMAQLKETHDSLASKLSTVKDPERRAIMQARLDDLSKQLKTPFDVDMQWFSKDPADETLGNLFADEQAQPAKPSEPFQLEQPTETPTKKAPPPATQETFGFSDMTPAQVVDEAQQGRMFEPAHMEQSFEEWVAAGEKITPPTEETGFTPKDPATFNKEFMAGLNDPQIAANFVLDLRGRGEAKNISTDMERIAYMHRDDKTPALTDSEMVRFRSAVRRNIDLLKQFQAAHGDENMVRQLEHEATLPDPTETRLRKELTAAKTKVKEQEAVLEQLRQRADISRERNPYDVQQRTGKEFSETATEAVKKALADQEVAVATAHRDEAIKEAQVTHTVEPLGQADFESVLFHDPGWDRAQASIADLKDQLSTAQKDLAHSQREAEYTARFERAVAGTERKIAKEITQQKGEAKLAKSQEEARAKIDAQKSKVVQLRDALTSARKEANIVVSLVKQDFKLRQAVRDAQVQARKVRDKMYSNISNIVKNRAMLPDEYKGPLDAIAGRITKNMGNDMLPIDGIRDIGALLGDHDKHQFSVWDKTDVNYLTELAKKPPDQWTVNDLSIVNDAINDFAMQHQLENMLKVQGEKVAKQYAAQQMNGEVAKRNTEQMKAHVKAMNGKPEAVDAMWGLLKALGKEEMHYSNLVAWLSGGEDSMTHKVLAGEVEKGSMAFRERVNRWGELHTTWFKDKGLNEFDFFRAKKKVQVAADGETRDLTAGYVISAYMHSQREDNMASFRRGTSIASDKHFNVVKMSDELIQKMFDQMTPQEKEYADHLTSVVSQVSKELDDAFYSRYQRHPTLMENYWHISRITETMTRIKDRKFQGIDVGTPDIFKHRTGAVTEIYWRPAETELFDLMNRAGRWIDLGEQVGHARSMLAEISLELKKQQGDDKATNMIAKGLAAYAGKGSTREEFEKVILKMRSSGIKSVLGGPRITTMTKNAALGIRSMPYIQNPTSWIEAAFSVMAHPKKYHDIWTARSGLYEDIARAGGSKELQDLFIAESKHPKLQRVLMAPEMAGFRAGSRIELESMHRDTLKEFSKGKMTDQVRRAVEQWIGKPKDPNGLGRDWTPDDIKKWTPEERDVLATKAAEALLKRNHATISPGFQANLTREGMAGLLATTLQSEKMSGLNMVVGAWMDAPKTKNGYKTAVKASMVHFIAEPAIMAGIRVAWLAAVGGGTYALLHKGKATQVDLKKAATDEVVMDWFSNIISGGDLYYITKQAIATAKRGTSGSLTLLGQYPTDFLNIAAGITALSRAKNDTARFNAALSLGIDSMSLLGMSTGLPIKGTADTVVGVAQSVMQAIEGTP
jgi:hypothetical protein